MTFSKQQLKIALVSIFLLTAMPVFAKELHFSFTPYAGLEQSTFQEAYYYEDFSRYKDRQCSLLEWTQKLSYLAGIETRVKYKKLSFFIDLSTKLPGKCGSMMDSDYLENGMKFNYSISENHLNSAFDAQTGFSYEVNLPFMQITPSITASYSYISFSAKNGRGWYGDSSYTSDGKTHSWDSPYSHYFPDGKYHLAGVDYLNQTFYFMTGLELSKNFIKEWRTGLGFHFAPFTYSYTKDQHLGKNKNFYTEGYIYNYFGNMKFTFQNDFTISSLISINTRMELNLQLFTKGKTDKNGRPNQQQEGESYSAFKTKIGISFSL